jgi:hypothetical protein
MNASAFIHFYFLINFSKNRKEKFIHPYPSAFFHQCVYQFAAGKSVAVPKPKAFSVLFVERNE